MPLIYYIIPLVVLAIFLISVFFYMVFRKKPKSAKEIAYQKWYNSLPLEEQHKIDMENERNAAAGFIMFSIMMNQKD